jgi:hypothetical protein
MDVKVKVDPSEIRKCIIAIDQSRQTHIEWLNYYKGYPKGEKKFGKIAGDAQHQKKCIEKYTIVIDYLTKILTSCRAQRNKG